MQYRSKLSVAAGALLLLAGGSAGAQLPIGAGPADGIGSLSVIDTSALGATLLQTGADAATATTAGTPLAPLGAGAAESLSRTTPVVTLPLAYIDFALFDGPVPLPRVFPDSPVAFVAPLVEGAEQFAGQTLPGLADLPQVSIVPRLDPLPVPIPQLGQALDQ